MKLDLAINNILLGEHVEGQLDVLVHEARRERKKSVLQKLIASGWKGKAGLVAVSLASTYATWRAYKYLDKLGEERDTIQQAIFEGLAALWSKDTAKAVAADNFTEWGRVIRKAINDARIPIVGPLVGCIVTIIIGIVKRKKEPDNPDDPKSVKKEAKKAAKKAFDKSDKKVKYTGGKNIIQHRLEQQYPNSREKQVAQMVILWDEGKDNNYSLYDIIYIHMQLCGTGHISPHEINLTGVSPKALGQAFVHYLGQDYSAPGARQNWS